MSWKSISKANDYAAEVKASKQLTEEVLRHSNEMAKTLVRKYKILGFSLIFFAIGGIVAIALLITKVVVN